MLDPASAAASGTATGPAPASIPNPDSCRTQVDLGDAGDHQEPHCPRVSERGGSRLSDPAALLDRAAASDPADLGVAGRQLPLDYDVFGPGSDELSEWLNGQAFSAINRHAKPVLDAIEAGDFVPAKPADVWERIRPEDGDLVNLADTVAVKARNSGRASPHGNAIAAALAQLREVRRVMDVSPSRRPTLEGRRKRRSAWGRRKGAKGHASRRLRRTGAEARMLANAAAGLSDAANLADLQQAFGESLTWKTPQGVGAARRRLQAALEALQPDPVTTEPSAPPSTCSGTTVRGRPCGRRVTNGATGCRYHPDAVPPPEEPAATPFPAAAPFPAQEIEPWHRWPAKQFMIQTGNLLDAGDARWLCDVGRCCEAEGRVDELMGWIRAAAGEDVRDPWNYLQRCILNRGDGGGRVDARLLADVLAWCGRAALEYALIAIGNVNGHGHVEKPALYLRRMLQVKQATRGRDPNAPRNLVAVAVGLAQRWAPQLSVDGAEVAVREEKEANRTLYLDSYRRRHGRLPWEDAEPAEAGDVASVQVQPEPEPLASEAALSPCAAMYGGNAAIPVNPVDDFFRLLIQKESSESGSTDSKFVTVQPPPADVATAVATPAPVAVQVQPEPEPETGAKLSGDVGAGLSRAGGISQEMNAKREPAAATSKPAAVSASVSTPPPSSMSPAELKTAADPPLASEAMSGPMSAPIRAKPEPAAARKTGDMGRSAPATGTDLPVWEPRPCRHPLAGLLAAKLDLARAVREPCAHAGCACLVYSDAGPRPCPCHLPPAKAAAVLRRLEGPS